MTTKISKTTTLILLTVNIFLYDTIAQETRTSSSGNIPITLPFNSNTTNVYPSNITYSSDSNTTSLPIPNILTTTSNSNSTSAPPHSIPTSPSNSNTSLPSSPSNSNTSAPIPSVPTPPSSSNTSSAPAPNIPTTPFNSNTTSVPPHSSPSPPSMSNTTSVPRPHTPTSPSESNTPSAHPPNILTPPSSSNSSILPSCSPSSFIKLVPCTATLAGFEPATPICCRALQKFINTYGPQCVCPAVKLLVGPTSVTQTGSGLLATTCGTNLTINLTCYT